MDFDAIVLAGGAARRLSGVDKAGVVVGGSRLLDRVLDALADARAVIVAGPRRDTPHDPRWVRETPPGGGPVAGLQAALPFVSSDVVVVLAVDLPFVDTDLVGRLVGALVSTNDFDGVLVTDRSGREQPLAGAYRRAWLTTRLSHLPRADGASMRSLLAGARLARMPEGLRTIDCDTWAEVARARWIAGRPARGGGAAPGRPVG